MTTHSVSPWSVCWLATAALSPLACMVDDEALDDAASEAVLRDQVLDPGEAVEWENVVNAEVDGSTLTRSEGTGWTAGASSVQEIAQDKDGFVEFTAAQNDSALMAGLSFSDSNQGYPDIDFAFYLRQDGDLQIYEDGSPKGNFGEYEKDDIFRIEVVEGKVRYRKNGLVIHSSAGVVQYPLQLDTSLSGTEASITNAGIMTCEAGDTSCMPAETWKNVRFVTSDATTLVRNVGSGWVAGASSVDSLAENVDGYVEFSTSDTDHAKMAGLSYNDANQDYADIDFAFYLRNDTVIAIYEDGHLKGYFGNYEIDDLFRIEVVDGQIRYRHNGQVIHTNNTSAIQYPLELDTSFNDADATITNASIHDCTGLEDSCIPSELWENVKFATADGSALERNAGNGWTAGASSVQKVTEGDGYVAFSTNENTLAKMAGLSHDDASQSYQDIDFAFYLRSDKRIAIYEDGHSQGYFGTYEAGDEFRIEVANEKIRYRHNGDVIHTNTTSTFEYPLALDTSLNQDGATITNAEVQDCAQDDTACMPVEVWTNARYVTVSGGTITRNIGQGQGWGAGASSSQMILDGEGYVEFSTSENSLPKMAGLSNHDANQNYADIDFAFYLREDQRLTIYEDGHLQGEFGTYDTGDVFRVEFADGQVRYRHNGNVVHTRLLPVIDYPLALDTSLYKTQSTITAPVVVACGDAHCFATETWKNVRFATATATALTRLAGTGSSWASGASSRRRVAPDDSVLRFSTSETNIAKMIGLGHNDAHQSYEDINFAIYLRSDGNIAVYESGNSKGLFGSYGTDDVFRIEMVDGRANYYKNNDAEPFYQSTSTTECPLEIDTSLYAKGATVTDVVLSGSDYSPGPAPGCPRVRVIERVSENAIFVRTEPRESSSSLGTLAYGAEVEVDDVARCTDAVYTGNWYAIDFEGDVGYIWGNLASCFNHNVDFVLPFDCGDVSAPISVGQGNGGVFSHNEGGQSHYAFDFSMPVGTPIYPIASGEVVTTKDDGEVCYSSSTTEAEIADCKQSANLVTIRHDDGTQSIYAHLSDVEAGRIRS
ncbi:peptidoglycan DD-metalloendopeptidase family protein [Pseudenhygromyxa sp. WMMC2535]|uniref:peptidoglycan DD-metalloendopeptidase family protein n=1 Tax=Pseudenhygromyxa sp. WMMC2535 TaxID=2712867 RepID=UPI001595CA84|nr:peptidoglycan DD-metalloendopeptidase family protein [Pseudenhygromyxa sp. WMMC2535]NVB37518.1 peptidoglycan DD-metalloendopeptidase family protein [Pseudenhygromyxa sp. WMMC2535]